MHVDEYIKAYAEEFGNEPTGTDLPRSVRRMQTEARRLQRRINSEHATNVERDAEDRRSESGYSESVASFDSDATRNIVGDLESGNPRRTRSSGHSGPGGSCTSQGSPSRNKSPSRHSSSSSTSASTSHHRHRHHSTRHGHPGSRMNAAVPTHPSPVRRRQHHSLSPLHERGGDEHGGSHTGIEPSMDEQTAAGRSEDGSRHRHRHRDHHRARRSSSHDSHAGRSSSHGSHAGRSSSHEHRGSGHERHHARRSSSHERHRSSHEARSSSHEHHGRSREHHGYSRERQGQHRRDKASRDDASDNSRWQDVQTETDRREGRLLSPSGSSKSKPPLSDFGAGVGIRAAHAGAGAAASRDFDVGMPNDNAQRRRSQVQSFLLGYTDDDDDDDDDYDLDDDDSGFDPYQAAGVYDSNYDSRSDKDNHDRTTTSVMRLSTALADEDPRDLRI